MNSAPVSPSPQLRNLRFELDADIPRYWLGGRRAVTLFYDNLSVFFPAGERFFITSVKANLGAIDDLALKRDAQTFCAQEGVHLREHSRYNERLVAHGYPISALERRIERTLKTTSRWAPRRRQLAVTCALEHFTAMMGHILLSDPRLLDGAHPEMAALWRWHATEETEHKAVAFEVYQAAGGSYLSRAFTMWSTTIVFWSLIILQQIALMRADRCLGSLSEWRSLFTYLFVNPGGMARLWRQWLDYFRPSFHPWQLDNRQLLERWVAELGPRMGGS